MIMRHGKSCGMSVRKRPSTFFHKLGITAREDTLLERETPFFLSPITAVFALSILNMRRVRQQQQQQQPSYLASLTHE